MSSKQENTGGDPEEGTGPFRPEAFMNPEEADRRSKAEAHQRERRVNEAYGAILHRSGIPRRFREARLSDFSSGPDDGKREAKIQAQAYLGLFDEALYGPVFPVPVQQPEAPTKLNFLLTGGFGTGKTRLASAVFKALVWSWVVAQYDYKPAAQRTGFWQPNKDFTAHWRKFYDLVGHVQDGYRNDTAAERIKAFQTADLLLIDDLGDGREESADKTRILYEVVDYRVDAFLPTIMTTNLDSEALKDIFGQRTIERLNGTSVIATMKGRNYRLDGL